MNTSMDTLVIEIESVANQATKGIEGLIDKLSELQQSLKDTVKASSNFSKLQQNINSSTKSTKVSQPTQATPKQPFAQYGSKESQFQNLGIDQSSLGKAISTTKTATQETNKYKTALGQLVTVVEKTNNGMTGYRVTLSQVNKQSQKGTSIFKAMTSGISGIAFQFNQIWDTVSRVASGLGNVTNSAASYYESLNLFATTLGENAQEAMDWVNKFSTALYLDPADVMQYMGSFNSLIKGLGVGTDNAYLMSQQLTQLTYDLASFKNLDFETAFQKLQSGISGEIEPLRNVGVALSEATLAELAFSLGLEENVRDMSEAEKAQLRYIQIMKSSTEWQADMGKTLTSPANALRVIKQQFSLLGRAIGNVFIPIIMFAIPYVMVFTEILTDLANALAKLLEKVFGIKLDFSLDTGGFDTGVGAITGGLGDIGDAADETKNKLNTTLAPFDELNNVQSKSKSEDDGSGGLGGGDLGVDLPTYDALSKLTDNFSKNIEKARENLKSLLPVVLAVGAAFATWKIGSAIARGIIGVNNFKSALEGISGTKINWSQIFGGMIIAAGIALTAVGSIITFDAFKQVLENNGWDQSSLMQFGIGAATTIAGGILVGLGIALVTGASLLGGALVGGLVAAAVVAIAALGVTIAAHWDEIVAWFQETLAGIGEFFTGIWESVKETISGFIEWLNVTIIQPIWSLISPVVESIIGLINTLGETASIIFNGIMSVVTTVFQTIWQIAEPIITGIIDIVTTVGTAVFTVVNAVWDIIAKVIEIIWTLVSTLFSNIFNIVSSVVGFVYDNMIEPVVSKITEFVSNIIDKVTSIVSAINKNVIKPVVDLFSGLINTVLGFFGDIGSSVANSFMSVFKSVLNGAFTTVEKLVNGFISALNTAINVINAIPGVSIKKLKKIELPRFEEGGYPDADLFMANENGIPEMVGRIGNRTAVANTDQITTAIASAVTSAINNSNFGGNGQTVIYIGNKKVYEGYGQHVQRENDRYGTNMIRI